MKGKKDKKDKKEERLGDILVRTGMITKEQLDKAVQCQVLFGGRLGTNLLELGFVRERDLLGLLEKKYGLDSVTRDDLREIPIEVFKLVGRSVAETHNVVPVRLKNDALEAAMLDPWRESAVQALVEATSLKIKPLIALELDILWALEKYYGVRRGARLVNLDGWIDHQRGDKSPPPVKMSSHAYKTEPLLPNPQDITSIEGEPKTLDDFWDRVGRSGHPEYLLPRVLRDLDRAETREQIATIVLDFASISFKRSILFVVNEDMLFGWDGRGQGIDSRMASAIMIPLTRRSVFRTVVETGAYFLGPIPDSPINRRFMGAIGSSKPKSIILLPVVVAGKAVAILYGDMGHRQAVDVKLAPIQNALHTAGNAFHRMIVRKKAEKPKPAAG